MDGNDDFRPEAAHRASDPSIEEILRRARDAQLGGDARADERSHFRIRPLFTLERRSANAQWFRERALLVAGVLVGILIAYLVAQAGAVIGSVLTPTQPTMQSTQMTPMPAPTPTNTPFLTPTDTPVPTPTNFPGATSPTQPTTDEIAMLAQDFYDTLSPFAGTYALMNEPEVQIQSQDDTQLTACIAYNYAPVSAPGTIAGTDTRLFTLALGNDGSWQVMGMGAAASCRMS